MVKTITSINNEIIKENYKLLRNSKSQYIAIENVNLISPEFCTKNNIHYLFCTQDWYNLNMQEYNIIDNKIIIVDEKIINKLGFAQSSQKVLLIIKYEYKNFIPIKGGKYFILEMLNDPGNLGTILRNAVAFGFNELFINKNSVSPLNEKVVRASMGALQVIKINFYSDLNDLIDQLRNLEINLFATSLETKSLTLDDFKLKDNYAIVMGNEARGISKKYLDKINNSLYIPINGIESLNVANACAIIMYQLRQIGSK